MEKLENLGKLPKDVLILLAVDLNLPDIISLCRINQRMNRDVCENPVFWRNKIMKDFSNANYISKNTRNIYLKLDKLARERPELKAILSLIIIDNYKFPSLSGDFHYTYIEMIENLLNSLDKNVLNKIVVDYNKHEYGRDKQIVNPTSKDIIEFIEKSGIFYREEYIHYYDSLIEQLKEYIKNPNFTFDPSVWERYN